MKKSCCICEKELGFMSLKVMLTDGYVCSKCWAETGRTDMAGAATLSSNNVRNFINLRKESQSLISKFSATKEIGSHAKFDDNSKTFMIGKNIFRYQNLLDYELIEDGETITKGGLGRAVAGGVLFGGVGAIVGGVTGAKKTKNICNSMKIKLTLRDTYMDTVYIPLITTETKTKSFIYKTVQNSAQECLSMFKIVIDQVERENSLEESAPQQSTSVADEILKFKNLMDSGIITAEEFETKKKQLLGL